MQEDIPAFEDFADGDQGPARITAQVVKQANELVVSVYANMGDMFEGANLGKLGVHTFLNNKATLPSLLYRPRRAHMNNISNVQRWLLQSARVLTFAIRILDASAIDAPSLATGANAYDPLRLHQGL